MVDITTPETRTRRLSILDSFMLIGFIVGLPFGTLIKNNHGLVVLYSIAAGITLIAMVNVFFVVKDSRKNFDEEKKQEVKDMKSGVVLGCNKGDYIEIKEIIKIVI
jgi:predicted MFS family arabinose efflux permease